MGRPKKECFTNESGIKIKGEKWSQPEMETLASLCVAHGRSGIMSKETNKATIAKKDSQWIVVQSMFNSMHPPREIAALQTRYKFIVMYLRKYNAKQRQNILATGGGPRDVTEQRMPFVVTGPILELSNALGVSITGLEGFGSDSTSLPNSNPPSKALTETCDGSQSFDVPNFNNKYTFDDSVNDNLNSLLCDDTELTKENTESDAIDSKIKESHVDASVQTKTPSMDSNVFTASFPGRSQFFQTSAQRRTTKRPISSTEVRSTSEAYIAERERRASEKHTAEMQYEKMLLDAKLEEMRENAKERQVERERRAELHAMTIRHKENLFSRQSELLRAALNVLTRSNSEIGVSSTLLLAMNQAGVSFVDASEEPQCNKNVGNELT